MARVSTIAQSVRDLAGGCDHFDVKAATLGALADELDRRHPGLGCHLRTAMVVAINGEMHHEAWHTPLAADAEVVFIPMIAGG